MEIVENAVIEAIKNKILDRKTIKTLAEKACSLQEDNSLDKLKELQTELKNVQKSKNNIIAAIEQGIITPTTKSIIPIVKRILLVLLTFLFVS